jgi:zinc transport system permease protein
MIGLFSVLSEMFAYSFLLRAFIVGALVSLCAALLGVSLVLKRYSMIGDGLSHVGFGALALATAMNAAPLTVAIPVVVAAAFLLLRLSGNSRIKGDAAIALISTSALALGVVIISQTTGMNTDVCNYLFGSILAMSKNDVYLSIALSVTVLVLYALFYHKLFAITFDESFAQAAGVRTKLYNMLIAFLTAITIVLGMRMMGAMLISSLIIFPALTSMRVLKKFKTVTICSALVSVISFFTGLVISYLYATPTGASIVMINIFAFLLFWGITIFTKGRKPVKKTILVSIVSVFLIAGCGGGARTFRGDAVDKQAVENAAEKRPAGRVSVGDGVVEIKEKMFIAQTNDVYLNPEDYMGRTIKLQGLFKKEWYDPQKDPYCFVLRYGPGCCGNDGNAGFEVAWNLKNNGSAEAEYPQEDDWVEAAGVLASYEEDGYPYLYIELSSLKVLDERGAEFVTQ